MIYTYNIASDFVGGYFDGDVSNRLLVLCEQHLGLTPVISSADGVVSVDFGDTTLTTPQKTTLDNNSTGPAGGLIARSTEHFEVIIGGNVIPIGGLVGQVANGILSTVVTFQLKDGTGANIGGSSQDSISIEPFTLSPLTATSGAWNTGNGSFSLTVGPTFSRGIVSMTVRSGSLPERSFSVEFA